MSGLELPPPPGEMSSSPEDDCRLWVGNLDTRITEFALLKLLQKYGQLKKFDFLYHKSGPDQGKPRGYCFASYPSKEEAKEAIKGLNGKLALSKKLIVRWAHADKSLDPPDSKAKAKLQLAPPVKPEVPMSKESKIRQIEEKLRLMESQADDLSLITSQNEASGCLLDKRKTLNAEVNQRRHYNKKPYSRTDIRPTHRQSDTRR